PLATPFASHAFFSSLIPPPPLSTLFPYTTLFRSDLLPVGALDHDLGLARRLDGDAFRNGISHRVREAQGQVEHLALRLRAVTDAHQLELALEAFRRAFHHVGQQGTGGAGKRHRLLVIHVGGDTKLVAFLDDLHVGVHGHGKLTLRAFHLHFLAGERHLNAFGDLDRSFCNSGHFLTLQYQETMQSTSPPSPC